MDRRSTLEFALTTHTSPYVGGLGWCACEDQASNEPLELHEVGLYNEIVEREFVPTF